MNKQKINFNEDFYLLAQEVRNHANLLQEGAAVTFIKDDQGVYLLKDLEHIALVYLDKEWQLLYGGRVVLTFKDIPNKDTFSIHELFNIHDFNPFLKDTSFGNTQGFDILTNATATSLGLSMSDKLPQFFSNLHRLPPSVAHSLKIRENPTAVVSAYQAFTKLAIEQEPDFELWVPKINYVSAAKTDNNECASMAFFVEDETLHVSIVSDRSSYLDTWTFLMAVSLGKAYHEDRLNPVTPYKVMYDGKMYLVDTHREGDVLMPWEQDAEAFAEAWLLD